MLTKGQSLKKIEKIEVPLPSLTETTLKKLQAKTPPTANILAP